MDTDSDTETQWTDEARLTYASAIAAATASLQEHVDLVGSRSGAQAETASYFASTARLRRALADLADAEFGLTGSFPFSMDLDEDDEDDDFDEDDAELLADDVPEGQTWLHVDYEAQFRITDRDGLLTAGREAYLEAWPDDTQDDAVQAIPTPEHAVGELLHRHGLGVLDRETTYLAADWHQVGVLESTEELSPSEDSDE